MSEAYKELCRQSMVNQADAPHAHSDEDGNCFVEYSLMRIALIEVVTSQPLLVVFHNLLSERTMLEVRVTIF